MAREQERNGRPLIDDVLLLNSVREKMTSGDKITLTLEEKKRLFVVSYCMTTVYFIAAPLGGVIKIGKTTDMKKRLSTLSTMSPVPLEVISTVQYDDNLEARIHRHLKDHRSHGEWFHSDEPVLEFMRGVRDGGIEWVVGEVGDASGLWMNKKPNLTSDMKDILDCNDEYGGWHDPDYRPGSQR